MAYTNSIIVEDASGCRFHVREYRRFRLLVWFATFELDNGEKLNRIDVDTFLIARTGEGLVRVPGG